MRFQVGRVDHDRLVLGPLGCQAHHDPGEDTIVAPVLPAVVQGLRGFILLRRVASTQTITVDEYYAAQHAPVVDAALAHPQENSPPDCFLIFGYSWVGTASGAPFAPWKASKGCSSVSLLAEPESRRRSKIVGPWL